MRKILAIVLVFMLVFGLAACAKTEEPKPAEEPQEEEPVEEEPAEEPVEEEPVEEEPVEEEPVEEPAGGLMLGVGHAFENSAKEPTDDADGEFQSNAYVVALLVGEDGVVVDCFIDVAQCKLAVSDKGEVLEADKAYQTKRELGDAYGMQVASSLENGEWYQQADALEAWVIGKTRAEVEGMAVDEKGKSLDADLLAGCTVGHMPVFIEAISNAFDNLVSAGNAVSCGVGVHTSSTGSANETEEEDGKVQFYSYYGYSALDAAGVITACVIDSAQITGTITDGVVTPAAEVKTKNELKEAYGMQAASGLENGEWYQQAQFLADYLVGKDKAGLAGLEFGEDDKATDPDLLAGCTMGHLTDIVASVIAGM